MGTKPSQMCSIITLLLLVVGFAVPLWSRQTTTTVTPVGKTEEDLQFGLWWSRVSNTEWASPDATEPASVVSEDSATSQNIADMYELTLCDAEDLECLDGSKWTGPNTMAFLGGLFSTMTALQAVIATHMDKPRQTRVASAATAFLSFLTFIIFVAYAKSAEGLKLAAEGCELMEGCELTPFGSYFSGPVAPGVTVTMSLEVMSVGPFLALVGSGASAVCAVLAHKSLSSAQVAADGK